jgi:predicted MFS family arabinose efflux permease
MEFRQLDNLLIYEFLKNLAFSLIGIFIPVYIVSEGFGLLPAALFIVISGVSGMFLSYPISKLISRFGFKHSLVASYFFLLPGLAVIRGLELSVAVIVVSSILYNIGRLIHNISMNSEFAVDSEEENRSDDSGKMLSLPSLSRILGPLLGGIIFAGLGFNELLMSTIAILGLTAVPLLLSREHRDPMEYDITTLMGKESLKNIPLFTARGIQAVTAVDIFALFVFMVIGGSVDVGAARALDSLGFVATGLIVGRYASRDNRNLLVGIGCLGAAAAFFFRPFLQTSFQVFILSFISGIFFQIYHVPVYSRFANEAEDTDILEFYTLRKVFVSLGNILTTSMLVIFSILFDLRTGFAASFILGGLATLTMAIVYRET